MPPPTPMTTALPPPPFDDCLHTEWTLGCPRCFWEATNVAKGHIKADTQDDAIGHQTEGAILFAWHMVMVLQDLSDQCTRQANQELDISRIGVCRDLAANIAQVAKHVIQTVNNPAALTVAMQRAALVCLEMQRRHQGAPPDAAPVGKSIIQLTDVA